MIYKVLLCAISFATPLTTPAHTFRYPWVIQTYSHTPNIISIVSGVLFIYGRRKRISHWESENITSIQLSERNCALPVNNTLHNADNYCMNNGSLWLLRKITLENSFYYTLMWMIYKGKISNVYIRCISPLSSISYPQDAIVKDKATENDT